MIDILVSVIVVCYNAEQYIYEALDSVKSQTYEKIELIVSDDCSTDNTYELCSKWLSQNNERFESVKLLRTSHNSGVTINCDTGGREASGKWIKFLSGDDCLPKDSIEKSISFIIDNSISDILCTRVLSFVEKDGKKKIVHSSPTPYTKKVFSLPADKQYKKMLFEYIMPTEYLVNKETLERVGYFETKFPDIEDYPLGLKLTSKGIKIEYAEIVGYLHRVGIESISGTNKTLFNYEAFKIGGKQHRQDKMFVIPNIKRIHVLFYYHYYVDLLRRFVVIHVMKNKNNSINRLINRVFLLIDPISLKKIIYNKIYEKTKAIH